MQTRSDLRRRAVTALLAVTVPLTGIVVTAAPAHADATAEVVANKLKTKTAPWGGKATIEPNISSTGQVEVVKANLTVKKGKKTVAKNKASVKLSAGTYKVTQTVAYRTYTMQTQTQTITKQKVGAVGLRGNALTPVAVTCTASTVVPTKSDANGVAAADVDAVCTSPTFDGPHRVVAPLTRYGTWFGYARDTFDQFETKTLPSVGTLFDATLWPWNDLMISYQTTEVVTTNVYSAILSKSRTQTLVIKKGKKPKSVWVGGTSYNCPKGFPIKGNADSGIYHVPGNRWYKATKPEECFATAKAARAAGYRAAKV